MINDDELSEQAEAAHNGLADTDDRYGKRSAYVRWVRTIRNSSRQNIY